MRTGLALGVAWLAATAPLSAQAAPAREVRAARIGGGEITLDGRLAEEAWRSAPAASGFVQREPREGAPAGERTEVRFVYGPDALYVGARMFRTDPGTLRAPVARRDNPAEAEHLLVSLDTYLDRRTAYTFGVTAAGTRLDWYHPDDREESVDRSFDPVWEARTQVDSLGWTAEMRIPYSQLRFHARPVQSWGVNLRRSVPDRNEEAYWVLVPKEETGWSSRFGTLAGLEGIRPTRRAELLPYAASGATFTGDPGEGNPFDDGSTLTARAGGDVKMGIGPGLTLEGTVNPDFGQVEADPAEVNLTAFETFFEERRPFFTEGSQLLRGGGAAYLYTRRIGAVPRVSVAGDHVDVPRTTSILGAGKLTGRLRSGTSLGVLGAVTDGAEARTWDRETGVVGRVPVAPLAGFGVLRAQQELGGSGGTVGAILTGVRRDLPPGDPLAGLLHREAYAGGADWSVRLRGGAYEVSGWAGFSHVRGDSTAILGAQHSATRYFQRPDADHVEVDSSRTSLSGYTAMLSARKNAGRWLWNTLTVAYSPGFEINDLGSFRLADNVFGYANLRYRETRPGRLFRDWQAGVGTLYNFNFGGTRTYTVLEADGRLTWRNYWTTTLRTSLALPSLKDRLTWGGPLAGIGHIGSAELSVASRAASPTRWGGRVSYREGELGEWGYSVAGELSLRPSPRWQLSASPGYSRSTDPRQFITSRAGGPAATHGRRYVFSFVDRSEAAVQLRLAYLFTPDLSLEGYAEPFASAGRFHRFGELAAAGSRRLRVYGTEGTTAERQPDGALRVADGADVFTLPARDFDIRSFRSNAVLRWEWRPGSTLFVVWQQDRFARERTGETVGLGDLWESLEARGDNRLLVKLAYWLPVR